MAAEVKRLGSLPPPMSVPEARAGDRIINPHDVTRIQPRAIDPSHYSPAMIARFIAEKAKIDADLSEMEPSDKKYEKLQDERFKYERVIERAKSLLDDQRKLDHLESEYAKLRIQDCLLKLKELEAFEDDDEIRAIKIERLSLLRLQLANRYSFEMFKQINLPMQKEHRERIYWVPHCETDTDTFPVNGADITEGVLYGRRTLVKLFGAKADKVIAHSHNEFLKWLYMTPEEEVFYPKDPCVIEEFFICHKPENAQKPFYQELPIFMNCADFVYFTLFQAGLVKKAEIQAQYKQTLRVKDPSYFVGFDLRKFTDLDPMADFAQANRGDILVGINIETQKAEHILFLDQFDAEEGWQAISLWSEDKGGPGLDRIPLKRYAGSHTFRYCPLAIAMKSLEVRSHDS